jgi:hypothetical protein
MLCVVSDPELEGAILIPTPCSSAVKKILGNIPYLCHMIVSGNLGAIGQRELYPSVSGGSKRVSKI